jgi:NitT/TauT family transport system substrate-binding protein
MARLKHDWLSLVYLVALGLGGGVVSAQEKKLEIMNVVFSAIVPSRVPLWAAKEQGLFEKYGLDVRLVSAGSAPTTIQTLLSGSAEIAASGTIGTVTAVVQGAPLAIVGNNSWVVFKLAALPPITRVEQLRGQMVAISRPGALDAFSNRRLFRKAGLDPDKDVNLFPTGISNPDQRLVILLQGQVKSTLLTPHTILKAQLMGHKVNVVADLIEHGIFATEDFTIHRNLLKKNPERVAAFFKAVAEATRAVKKEPALGDRIIRKYLKQDDARVIKVIYDENVVRGIPDKPFPHLESVEQTIEDLRSTTPDLKITARDLIDASVVERLDKEGFFAKLLR